MQLLLSSGCPWWSLLPLLLLFMTGGGDAGLPGPRFVGQIENVTVAAGRNAVLTCTVEHLRGYKVAWVQVETQTILTIHTSVITRNPRVGLSHEGHNVFRLHLKEVTEADRGYYMCQMNTDPMINQQGFLQVVVPPDIDDSAWTGDLVVREGTNVSLECKARGYPPPTVTWRREDPHDPTQHLKVLEGQTLTIGKVSRLHMGAYLCVASNGIQPSVSKRIQLKVQFPPMLWIPNQLEGARRSESVTLQCNTEAFPRSINYWTNHRGEMIAATGTRYETTTKEESYKTYMRLVIHNLTQYDFNTYHCIAKNSLGETDGSIRLYEIEPRPTKEDSKEGSASKEDGEGEVSDGEGGEGGGGGGGTKYNSTALDESINLTTDKRGKMWSNKQSPSKKTGRGPNSWRTGEAMNEVLTEVDLRFREKEYSHSKDSPPGMKTASSYDHSFTSYDSGSAALPSSRSVVGVAVACVAALWRL
ncbi:lachesin-like isoform X3 [Scylla paramamosain]|uniref:lachesin-like isoform X3 n=1 Tax=Scylla paramamosain TaxID=85552 RepID=UPI003082AB0D